MIVKIPADQRNNHDGVPTASMSETGKEDIIVRGFRFPSMYNRAFVNEALSYQARPGDVFVSTYIKCGTTWLQYLVWCVHNLDRLAAGEGVPTMNDLLRKHVPFLEWVGTSPLDQLPEPRLMKHHFPFSLSPYHPRAKYVVVIRNPFDCAVSFYHMRRENAPSNGLPRDYDFDSFFETFIAGHVPYGSYFDHVLSWYQHRNDPNVHVLYYECLKEDTAGEVLKLANFLDKEGAGSRLRSDPDLLRKVIEKTSFKSLKTAAVPDDDLQDKDIGGWDKPKGPSRSFFRKGAIGDWRNYFSAEQEKRLKDVYFKRLGDTDMVKVWEKHLSF